MVVPENVGISSHELGAWIDALGSAPKERVAHADESRSYEMDVIHVFELENGKFAVVTESGCSCYCPEDADIELFPDREEAMSSFDTWVTQHKRDDHDSDY